MRRLHLVLSALVVVGAAVGGALECRPVRTAAQEQGDEVYQRMCAVCHGTSGEGYKADRAPAITNPAFLGSATDEFLRSAIRMGRNDTTMSAWGRERGGPLTAEEISSVIAYLRSFRPGPRLALDEHPLAGDKKRGEDIFGKECVTCHGKKGVGGPNIAIGSYAILHTATNGFLRLAILDGRKNTPMPGFKEKLGSSGVDDVVAYLRDLQSVTSAPVVAPVRPPPIPLGPVPLNPKGPDPHGFKIAPATTPVEVVHGELVQGARMAILDARAPSDYMNEHIAGAVSVPFYDPSPYLEALPKDSWLVCYCACPHAESGNLARELLAHGFKKVTILDEGLGVWKSRQHPTHTGTAP